MKLFHTRILLVLLTALSFNSTIAQSTYKPGYIVNITGDTLKGFIDYREWYRNPQDFSFKTAPGDEHAMHYSVDNSIFVEIDGYAIYQQFPVLVSMNEVIFDKLTESANQPDIQDTVFLKLLVTGKNLSLYSYRDHMKQRFYFLEKGATKPLELGYRLARIDGSVATFPVFRQQLTVLAEKFSDSSAVFRSAIERSGYIEKDMVKVVKSINGDEGLNAVSPVVKKKSVRVFLAAGVNHSIMKYSGENMITADGVDANDNRLFRNRKTSSLLPLVAIGTDLYFKREIQTLYVRLEIAAAGMHSEVNSLYRFSIYNAEQLSNNYQLSGVMLSFRPQLLVNILNKENVQLYIGAGPSMNYFVTMKNEMYQKTNQPDPPYSDHQLDDYMFVKEIFASVLVRAGVTLRKKIDLSLCRFNNVELNNNMASKTSSKYTSSQFVVAYKFRR